MDGVLVIDKPSGPSSHDVVARVRRAAGLRRVGHTGTLDPLATGVLPLVIGRASRLAQFLTASEKTYEAEILLGITTDTWDVTGTPTELLPDALSAIEGLTLAALEGALAGFVGTHAQQPPTFSAKKIGGVRAYDLARRRRAVRPEPVNMTAHHLDVCAFEPPLVRVRLTCSAGFYVRSLAHELGQRLGTGAVLKNLRRTRSGEFGLSQALRLDRVEAAPAAALQSLVPLEQLLTSLQSVVLCEAGVRRARHGNDLGPDDLSVPSRGPFCGRVRLLAPSGALVAIGETGREPSTLHPVVVLI